jgi:hypothetical protein
MWNDEYNPRGHCPNGSAYIDTVSKDTLGNYYPMAGHNLESCCV